MPNTIIKRIGDYDESCPGPYHIDSDYWVRLVKASVPVILNERVHIDHPEPARTLKHLNVDMELTKKWFIEKHGSKWLGLVA